MGSDTWDLRGGWWFKLLLYRYSIWVNMKLKIKEIAKASIKISYYGNKIIYDTLLLFAFWHWQNNEYLWVILSSGIAQIKKNWWFILPKCGKMYRGNLKNRSDHPDTSPNDIGVPFYGNQLCSLLVDYTIVQAIQFFF